VTQPVLKVFLKDGAKMPAYAHAGDSGLDLCSTADVTLEWGRPSKVPTGVHVEIPTGYEAQVRPRSGLSSKGVVCSFGTVDVGYTGEISVVLTFVKRPDDLARKDSDVDLYQVKAGDKIAQLVIAPVAYVFVEQVTKQSDPGETERGERGFGSSGR